VPITGAPHVEVETAPASQKSASSAEEGANPSGGSADAIEASRDSRRRYLLRRFWRDARGFWGTSSAWAISGITLLTILANLAALYGMNVWNRALFDGLEMHDAGRILFLSLIYFPIMVASVFFNVVQVYGRMTLQRRWRAWLNSQLVGRWLTDGNYYHLNLVRGDHQNPEFRIADDVRVATESPVDFVTGVVSAALSAITFIAVLWSIGGTLEFSVGGHHIGIPGFLVAGAVVYALAASGSMMLIGRRFVSASETKNQTEAEYRYILTGFERMAKALRSLVGMTRSAQGSIGRSRKCCRPGGTFVFST
jgi:vitamin B12/bleomycin/antimicrobial peptide transport system ATP-binding/permease protein